MGHLMLKVKQVAIEQNLQQGYRVVINNGENGGQEVMHLHIHVLGQRKMKWPPG